MRDAATFMHELDCSPMVAAVLERATAWERELRYYDAGAFCDALKEVSTAEQHLGYTTDDSTDAPVYGPWRRIGIMGVWLLLIIGGGGAYILDICSPNNSPNNSELVRMVDQTVYQVLEEATRTFYPYAGGPPEDLRGIDLRSVDLRGADLRGADLRSVDLHGADLRGADLRGAKYDDKTVWPAGFNPIARGAVKVDSDAE